MESKWGRGWPRAWGGRDGFERQWRGGCIRTGAGARGSDPLSLLLVLLDGNAACLSGGASSGASVHVGAGMQFLQ